MSYIVTIGTGNRARVFLDLDLAEAIAKAEARLADGRDDVAISGPHGVVVDLPTLKRESMIHSGRSG